MKKLLAAASASLSFGTIGSMSIMKGARNLEAAKVDPRVPDFKKIRFINYDCAKCGASAGRRRLISRWEKEVNSLPR